MMRWARVIRWAWVALLLASCTPEVPECTATSECGLPLACVDNACVEVDCRSSAQCALQERCNLETYECEPGCSTSDDCLVGDRCNVESGTCEARVCTNTQLDCELGERCNTTTGRCTVDPEPHCQRCGSDERCGPTGQCAGLYDSGAGYCFLECSPEAFDPCPAGLQCSAQQTVDGEPDGFRCVGLCEG